MGVRGAQTPGVTSRKAWSAFAMFPELPVFEKQGESAPGFLWTILFSKSPTTGGNGQIHSRLHTLELRRFQTPSLRIPSFPPLTYIAHVMGKIAVDHFKDPDNFERRFDLYPSRGLQGTSCKNHGD
jgi:hypothetical protein